METYRGVVSQWELDHMGHLNIRFYQAMFEAACWQLYGALGLTPGWMRDHGRGMAAVEQHILYRAELGAGALVVVDTEVTEVGDKILRFVHHLRDLEADVEAAVSEFVAVHLDTERRRAVPLPGFVGERVDELGLRPTGTAGRRPGSPAG
ncbi:MAG TPA: thioesterase [Actinobacteria bacterium]|nr:thioesterase [Actinomycetota bacterium]